MLRVSKLADYAVVMLASMAGQSCNTVNTAALAGFTKLPEPTVSKILKQLTKSGIVRSTRGINGGYRLARMPEDISAEEIIRIMDGPVSITACTDGAEPDCTLSTCCSVRGRWDGINTAIRDALRAVTLADMIQKPEEEKRYGSY